MGWLLIAAGVVGLIVWAGSAALDAMGVFPEDWND